MTEARSVLLSGARAAALAAACLLATGRAWSMFIQREGDERPEH
ncbi:MAG TPA: hypothetical protein VFS92_08745 [Planctomycetota bacterium]|nr:hypothetical protein [Planctomycetota bacterium]